MRLSPPSQRLLLPLLAGAVLAAAPAPAQQDAFPSRLGASDVLRGTVVKGGAPVPGVQVTLHRVRSDLSGEFGRQATDAAGAFSFRLPPPDTSGFAVFFATVDFEGARYFGGAIHPDDVPGDYAVEVFDSASSVPLPIRISRRDVLLAPQPDGSWEVDETVRVHNPNSLTLVPGGGGPSWEFRIPAGVEAFEVGEAEVPANQVRRMESRVLLTMPLVPGTRELFFRYRLPATVDDAVLAFDSPADTFNLFIRQPSPRVSVAGLASTDTLTVEEQLFLQYSALNLPVESEVVIEWESAGPPVDPVMAAVAVTLLLLGAAVLSAVRGIRPVRASRGPEERSASRDLAAGGAE